jgi:hypothetical protein
MVLNFEFKNKLKTLPIALSEFQIYQSQSNHTPTHLKIVYNVVQESSFVEATFSNEVAQSEITSDLTSSISYIFSELISSYLMTYKKVFLSRIIVESDIDMLGVVFESIKVTCKFKANVNKYSITTQKLLSLIFSQTTDAERNEILERPATSLNIFLLRHKLRSVQIVFDYSLSEGSTAYEKEFSSDFELALCGLIHSYESPQLDHEASAHLIFDLSNRNSLKFLKGSLFTTQILDFDPNGHEHFKNNQIIHILGQVDPILEVIDKAQISQLILNMTQDNNYKCQFELRRSKDVPENYINLTQVESIISWQKIFNQIVDVYSLNVISKKWLQTICVDLKPISDNWLVSYHDYYLTFNFKDLGEMVNQVNELVNNQAKVDQIILETQKNSPQMIQLHLRPLEIPSASPKLAMKLRTDPKDGKVVRFFNLSSKGYFLDKEIFKDMVK